MNPQRPILFLGFDGVLHPNGCAPDRYLEHLPMLASWLVANPTVDVVISSGWMKLRPNLLAARVGAAVHERVVGMALPNLGTSARGKAAGARHAGGATKTAEQLPLTDGNVLGRAREFDVFVWRPGWCWRGQPWRVLEASASRPSVQCLEMITVDPGTGVSAQTLVELDAWLDEMGGLS
jgi:hypothetical protein